MRSLTESSPRLGQCLRWIEADAHDRRVRVERPLDDVGHAPAGNVTRRWAGDWVFDPPSAGNGSVVLNITQDGSQVKGTVESLVRPTGGGPGTSTARCPAMTSGSRDPTRPAG